MNYGVVYKFKKHKKINGTLFYCFEYYIFLKQFIDINFYIVNISPDDLELIKTIFSQKYNVVPKDIISIKPTELYELNLDKTLILDVMSFYDCKEFLTNQIYCFSNDGHPMFRYKKANRKVTYYGSYDFQNYDIFTYLKFNFNIFKPITTNKSGVFISCMDETYIKDKMSIYETKFQKPIIIKKTNSGIGNIFDYVDAVHYVHMQFDKNNRIIPEAFYYGRDITIEETSSFADSIKLRYNDIKENGLDNYTLTKEDVIIKEFLKI